MPSSAKLGGGGVGELALILIQFLKIQIVIYFPVKSQNAERYLENLCR